MPIYLIAITSFVLFLSTQVGLRIPFVADGLARAGDADCCDWVLKACLGN